MAVRQKESKLIIKLLSKKITKNVKEKTNIDGEKVI
jgi:hypothetical protein